MKREMVTIFVALTLVIGISLIYVILNPYDGGETNNNKKNDTYQFDDSNYHLVNETGTFKEYALNDLISLDVYIENFNIKYKGNELKINDKQIAKNIYLYKRIALYKDAKLVLFIRNNETRIDELVIYNCVNDTFTKQDKLNNMYLDVTDDIYFEDAGFTINTTLVDETLFVGTSNSICGSEDSRIVYKYIEVLFDPNELEFNNTEDISSLDLFNYKKNNGYC